MSEKEIKSLRMDCMAPFFRGNNQNKHNTNLYILKYIIIYMANQDPSIKLKPETIEELRSRKIVDRETDNEVVARLLKETKE